MIRVTSTRYCVTVLLTIAGLWYPGITRVDGSPNYRTPGTEFDPTAIRKLILEGRFMEAETRLARVLPALNEQDPEGRETAATALDLLVECRLGAGRGGETRTVDLALQAVETREGDPDAGLSTSLVNLARVRHARAHASAAHHHYSGLLSTRERTLGPDSPDVRSTLITLGRATAELGDWSEASRLLESALAFCKTDTSGGEMPQVACLANLARVYGSMDDPAGQIIARRCETLVKSVYSERDPRLALALEDLARTFHNVGWDRYALDLVKHALTIWLQIQEPLHPFTSRTALHAAYLHRLQSNFVESRALYEEYLPVFEAWPDASPRELASAYAGYADVLAHLGHSEASLAWLRRAELTSAADPSTLSPESARKELVRAHRLALAGSTTEALEVALRTESNRREAIRLSGHTLPEEMALRVHELGTRSLDLSISLAATRPDTASCRHVFDAVIRSRALVLDELAVRYRTLCELDRPEIAQLFDAFSLANARVAEALVQSVASDRPKSGGNELLVRQRAREEAEAALAARSVVFRKELARSRAGLDEVVASLPCASALVSTIAFQRYIFSEDQEPGVRWYLAFVLVPESRSLRLVPLGPADRIDQAVQVWGKVVSPGTGSVPELSESACREAGDVLRRLLWDPIAPVVGSAHRVFFVPDATLHQVNLAALPAGENSYLLDTGPTFHYLSAERDLISIDSPEASSGLLAVGGVDFNAPPLGTEPGRGPDDSGSAVESHYRGDHSRCRTFESVQFESLPESQQEIAEIAVLWSSKGFPSSDPNATEEVIQLSGAAAGEAAVKRFAPGRRIVHLATHGFFLSGDCPRSAPGRRGIGTLAADRPPPGLSSSPLVLSGLALAGANLRSRVAAGDEDGILTAEEIATLDLHGVEWAVLSGCNTGVGNPRSGEGVFGLRRAFSIAGVRTLIMSLWSVEDAAAREWMRALYQNRYRDRSDTPTAVRQASLAILNERRRRGESTHPFYWGGFVAAGDWR